MDVAAAAGSEQLLGVSETNVVTSVDAQQVQEERVSCDGRMVVPWTPVDNDEDAWESAHCAFEPLFQEADSGDEAVANALFGDDRHIL